MIFHYFYADHCRKAWALYDFATRHCLFLHGPPHSSVHSMSSFVTFKEDVVFTDFDNQHIKCAFGFGAVDAGSHMQMMVKMAALLQDEEFLELARNHGTKRN